MAGEAMSEEQRVYSEIGSMLADELGGAEVQDLIGLCRAKDRPAFARGALERSGVKNVYSLLDYMCRKGKLTIDRWDYEFLLDILKNRGTHTELAEMVDGLITAGQAKSKRVPVAVRPTFPEPDAKRLRRVSAVEEDGISPGDPDYFASYGDKPKIKQYVLIINNFTEGHQQRGGTKRDSENIINCIQSLPASLVETVIEERRDCDKGTMEELLDLTKRRVAMEGSEYDRLFVYILSHGTKNAVHGHYSGPSAPHNNTIDIDDGILKRFSEVLPGKPKVIVIQACNGEGHNELVHSDSTPETTELPEIAAVESVESDLLSLIPCPRYADMLLACATVKGYRSYRSPVHGSWFIRELCEVMTRHYKEKDLLSMMTAVLLRVSQREGRLSPATGDTPVRSAPESSTRQMPYFQSTLRKTLYLIPNAGR